MTSSFKDMLSETTDYIDLFKVYNVEILLKKIICRCEWLNSFNIYYLFLKNYNLKTFITDQNPKMTSAVSEKLYFIVYVLVLAHFFRFFGCGYAARAVILTLIIRSF